MSAPSAASSLTDGPLAPPPRPRLLSVGAELGIATVITGVATLLAIAGVDRLGTIGLALPAATVAAVILVSRPRLACALVLVATILCEGPTFGLFTFTSNLYEQAYKDVSYLDLLVVGAVLSVAVDALRSNRAFWVPRPLVLPLTLLSLAMFGGLYVGHAAGASLRYAFFSENTLAYLLFLPVAVASLDIRRTEVKWALGVLAALALLKALLGLAEIATHHGSAIEGKSELTYYEPAANWLIMVTLMTVLAARLLKAKLPRWLWWGSPLLLACLVLSYRRSFWIATVLALLLMLLAANSSAGRRMLIPAALTTAAAFWLLGTVHFQSQSPVLKRLTSLSPSSLEANAEDRYRLDERKNVLGEIREQPITGLGVTIPWSAYWAPLSVEHEGGRDYVHFAALWFWLKLGILGLAAYIAVMLGTLTLAWRAWRVSPEPWMRAFAIASFGCTVGLMVMDTTASFTGVDPRFTVLFASQLGLLGLGLRTASEAPSQDGPGNVAVA